MDARVKLVFTLVFIIFVGLLPEKAWAAYILDFSLVVSIALISQIGYSLVLKRSLIALPFILAALPLIFTGPLPYLPIALEVGVNLHLSVPGCLRFLAIAAKSWICVQAAIVLAATTQFTAIVTAMKQMHVSVIFTSIIDLMWRYLFVIVEEAQRLMRARSSRSAVAFHSRHTPRFLFWQARVTGGMAGEDYINAKIKAELVTQKANEIQADVQAAITKVRG